MRGAPITLRRVWSDHITIADYERHMAAVGQVQANASLMEELFRDWAPRLGARLLFAGAGSGQYLDYLPGNLLGRYRATFADINANYLTHLAARVKGADFATVVDDIEESRLAGPFDLAVVVLVLEHVNWRKAVDSLAARTARVFVVIQQNSAAAPPSRLKGTLAILTAVPPILVDPDELTDAFAAHGFKLVRKSLREVPDGKAMVGLDYTR